MKRAWNVMILILCLFQSSFAGAGDSGNLWPVQQKTVSMNGIALNGLNGLQFNGLSAQALRTSGMALSPWVGSADAREVLRVLAVCALNAGDELTVTSDGVTYTFPGALGLAPTWRDTVLSPEGQRWVTACLMAHVNAFGEHIPISLRGVSSALQPTEDETLGYQTEEGAFFGNLFDPAPFLVSCVGGSRTDPQPSGDLERRICTAPGTDDKTACGFTTVGTCEEACTVHQQGDHRVYTDCRLTSEDPERVSEVITVFLRQAGPMAD